MKQTLAVLVLGCAAGFAHAAAPAVPTPADVVTAFHAALLDNMKAGDKLSCAKRSDKIAQALDADFDLGFIAERVLHREWKALDDSQRKALVGSLRELAIVTYSAEFKAYSGERFETLSSRALADGTVLVHGRILPSDDKPVTLDYVLRNAGGNPRVVNVIADGVSDLAVRSTQYDRAYKVGGYDELMKLLKSQIEANRKNC